MNSGIAARRASAEVPSGAVVAASGAAGGSAAGVGPRRYESAAATLGANHAVVLVTITLPLMLPGILAGTVLAFARALGEFGATITFVGNIPGVTQTIPSAIYSFTQVPNGEAPALRLTLVAVIVAFAALLASEALSRRASRRVLGR